MDDKSFSFNEIPGFIFTTYVINNALNFKYVACKSQSKSLNDIEYIKNGYLFEVSKDVRNAKYK